MKARPTHIVLAVLYLLAVAAYLYCAVRQKSALNLSATAGGQFPYLVYAKGVAEEGVTSFVGDRNRMPLVPTLLSLVYEEDWDAFVARSAWLGIFTSLLVLVGVGILAHAVLPKWSATVLMISTAFAVFLEQASFVQAELVFYGLFFLSWWLLVRVLRSASIRWAVAAGICAALAYLTKASALPLLISFVFFMMVRAVVSWRAASDGDAESESPITSPGPGRILYSLLAVVACFVVVVYPYISENQARFGRYFYNVNSTFYMWCDSWEEAASFTKKYHIDEQYPEAPPEEIPGPVNYWRTHSTGQILRRLFGPAVPVAFPQPRSAGEQYLLYGVVPLALIMGLALLIARRRKLGVRLSAVRHIDWLVGAFCITTLVGYILAYRWYRPVGYGERFILSLYLPVVCAFFWVAERTFRDQRKAHSERRGLSVTNALAIVLLAIVAVHSIVRLPRAITEPTRAFITFYYNESLERQKAGDLVESMKGFQGVLKLDAEFAPAHLSLGMNLMVMRKLDAAIGHLREAVQLDPERADAHNSLGSALVQVGEAEEAIARFRKAIELKPDFAMAWYNLGGTYCTEGAFEDALAVRDRLKQLDTRLAGQLTMLIDSAKLQEADGN
ncbi:MAG: tetratricopeptide repeat protein [Phycisphaerales bacterium]|nr:MAG: tetratricopeptide repeat protein [Phycisphaerales bacterium]